MSTIDEAIAAGKFSGRRRAHYERLYQRDPRGMERLIASLEAVPGLASPPMGQRGPARSDAGRRVVPGALGGYVVEGR